jgi:hypothetical protein
MTIGGLFKLTMGPLKHFIHSLKKTKNKVAEAQCEAPPFHTPLRAPV